MDDFPGQKFTYALKDWTDTPQWPVLGSGVMLPDFHPPTHFDRPASTAEQNMDKGNNLDHFWGTPMTHKFQQILARKHAEKQAGFTSGPVSFMVHWAYLKEGMFTYDTVLESWIQEDTEVRK